MARTELVLRAMLSSPSDLSEERQVVDGVITEFNKIWSRDYSLRIELFRWETDSVPGVSDRVQDVINGQIGEEYDLFIGLLRSRFGTPTGVAGSGTEEEFQLAYERNQATGRPEIMIYFSDSPPPLSQIDPDQLKKVNEFRSSLGAKGVLYHPFSSVGEFEKLLRLHLTRFSQGHASPSTRAAAVDPQPAEEPVAQIDDLGEIGDEPLGVLDLADATFTKSAEFGQVMDRMAESVSEVGVRISQRTAQMGQVGEIRDVGSLRRAKAAILGTASDLNAFARRLQTETPEFSSTFGELISAYTALFRHISTMESDELPASTAEAWEQATELLSAVEGAAESVKQFRESLINWPSLSAHLNKARRTAVTGLAELLREMETAKSLIQEIIVLFTEKLEDNQFNENQFEAGAQEFG